MDRLRPTDDASASTLNEEVSLGMRQEADRLEAEREVVFSQPGGGTGGEEERELPQRDAVRGRCWRRSCSGNAEVARCAHAALQRPRGRVKCRDSAHVLTFTQCSPKVCQH